MKKIFVYLGLLLILIIPCFAGSVSISQQELSFDKVYVQGYAEQQLAITADNENALEVIPIIPNNLKEWVIIEQHTTLFVSKEKPLSLTIIISPKSRAAGIYEGGLTLYIKNPIAPLIDKGREITLEIPIHIELTDEKIEKIDIYKVQPLDTEPLYPLHIFVKSKNSGNQPASLTVDIAVDNMQFQRIASLNPTQEDFFVTVDNLTLLEGIHNASVRIRAGDSEIINEKSSFTIRQRNSLLRKGTLVDLQSLKKAAVASSIPVEAIFKNAGELTVECTLQVDVYHENVLITALRSDKKYCVTGKSTLLNTSFNPSELGSYVLAGKVFYDTTVSDELDYSLDVVSADKITNAVPLAMSPYIVFILIILLLYITRSVLKKKLISKKHGARIHN
jgi:hypothetical protein